MAENIRAVSPKAAGAQTIVALRQADRLRTVIAESEFMAVTEERPGEIDSRDAVAQSRHRGPFRTCASGPGPETQDVCGCQSL